MLVTVEFPDLVLAESGSEQHRARIGAEPRRRAAHASWSAAELHGNAKAAVAVLLDRHLACRGVRMLQGLRHRMHRSRGHTGCHQALAQWACLFFRQSVLQLQPELGAVLEPRRVAREPREQVLTAEEAAQLGELAVVHDAEEHL